MGAPCAPGRDRGAARALESAQAEAHYRQALALAEALGMRPLQAHCHLGLGKLYAKIGRRAEARTGLSAAVELYRAMEMTFWLPQAEAALAEVEGLRLDVGGARSDGASTRTRRRVSYGARKRQRQMKHYRMRAGSPGHAKIMPVWE